MQMFQSIFYRDKPDVVREPSKDSINLSQDNTTTPETEASDPHMTTLPDTTDSDKGKQNDEVQDVPSDDKEADCNAIKSPTETEEKSQDVMKVEEECNPEAAKSIEIKEKEPKEWTLPDLNKEFRKFNIDLQPRVCLFQY